MLEAIARNVVAESQVVATSFPHGGGALDQMPPKEISLQRNTPTATVGCWKRRTALTR